MSFLPAEQRLTGADAETAAAIRLGGARFVSVAAMLGLYLLLGELYDNVVAPRYAFGAFRISPRPDSWVELVTVLAAGVVLPIETKRMSQIFAWLSTVFILIPAAVLSARQGSDRVAMFLMFGGVWLVMLLCRLLADSNILFGLDTTRATARIGLYKMLAMLAAVLVLLGLHVEGRMSFSLADVYEYRFDFNESLYFPLNYLLPFAAGPLAGFTTASALYKRRFDVVAAVMVMGLLFFGFSSHKAMLFYPPFVIAIYAAIASRYGHLYLMGIFFFLSVLTFLSVGTAWEDLLGSSFANRLVFIPAQIHYFFFREFGEIGPQIWAESRFGLGIFQSDLPIPSVNYIGLIMTGDAQIGANTGWIANGYMNGGWWGIMLYATILAVTLHAIDRLGDRYGYPLVGASFVIPIFSMINSIDLLAGFLTGGLLLLFVFVFWLIRPERTAAAPPERIA